MPEFQLTLTAEEKDFLVNDLDANLGDTRVEAHHTRTPAYKERVLRQEVLIRGLLTKLRQPVSQTT